MKPLYLRIRTIDAISVHRRPQLGATLNVIATAHVGQLRFARSDQQANYEAPDVLNDLTLDRLPSS